MSTIPSITPQPNLDISNLPTPVSTPFMEGLYKSLLIGNMLFLCYFAFKECHFEKPQAIINKDVEKKEIEKIPTKYSRYNMTNAFALLGVITAAYLVSRSIEIAATPESLKQFQITVEGLPAIVLERMTDTRDLISNHPNFIYAQNLVMDYAEKAKIATQELDLAAYRDQATVAVTSIWEQTVNYAKDAQSEIAGYFSSDIKLEQILPEGTDQQYSLAWEKVAATYESFSQGVFNAWDSSSLLLATESKKLISGMATWSV